MSELNWDDLRLLVALERRGSMLAAATALGLDHSTVSRRLAALELAVGAQLVERTPRGVRLTPAGQRACEQARAMERAVLAIKDEGDRDGLSGSVRLATPEAFGCHILAGGAAAFGRQYPAIEIQLVPEARQVSLTNIEADLAVCLARPARGPLAAQRLGAYHLGLYASEDYLARHGAPTDQADLARHLFVSFIDDLLLMPELLALTELCPSATVSFRSTSIAAQTQAVAGGVGLGVLHGYAARQDPRLVHVLPELDIRRAYWMVVRDDRRAIPRVRAVMDWVAQRARQALANP
jgi:DNA-binding transcriptional LysR family regulator